MKPLIDAEEWRPVVGFESSYEVSDKGRVRSLERIEKVDSSRTGGHYRKRSGVLLKPKLSNTGYLTVGLYKQSVGALKCLVHRLVAKAFLDGPSKEVNHKDGDRTNNCVENLEWCDRQSNALHSTRVLGKNRGEDVFTAKLREEEVLEIKGLLESGMSQTEISKMFNVSNHAIFRIQRGDNWSWLTGYEKKGRNTSCDR